MSIAFKNPQFLYALFGLLIPIIIHIFSFRKLKHVYFHSTYLFLQNQQQQQRFKNKLKHLLVLACRLLLFAAIIMLFAQPYKLADSNTNKQERATIVYVDNSFSSQLSSRQGITLPYMIKHATEFIKSLPAAEEVYCFTNIPTQAEQFSYTKEAALRYVSELQAMGFTKTIPEVYAAASALSRTIKKPVELYVFSDFQVYSSQFQHIAVDSSVAVYFVPFVHEQAYTISLDSCWFSSPYRVRGQLEECVVQISNKSKEEYKDFPVKLFVNDTLRAVSTVDLKPWETTHIKLNFSVLHSGHHNLRIEIEDYPLVYDNYLYASYSISPTIPILAIADDKSSRYVQSVLMHQEEITFRTQQASAVDYSSLHTYKTIIADGLQSLSEGLQKALIEYVQAGGNLIIIPSQQSDLESYNNFFAHFGSQKFHALDTTRLELQKFDAKHFIYKQAIRSYDASSVQLPIVRKHYPFLPVQHYAIMSLQNNNPFLSILSKGQGSLYVFSAPFGSHTDNEFLLHPLFIGFFTLSTMHATQQQLYNYLGEASTIAYTNELTDPVIYMSNKEKNIECIPRIEFKTIGSTVKLHPMNNIYEDGHYAISVQPDSILAYTSYNYLRKESELEFYNSNDIQRIIAEAALPFASVVPLHKQMLTHEALHIARAENYWKLFLIIALCSIAAEVLLLRFFK